MRSTAFGALLVALLVALLAAASPMQAASPTPFGVNLVPNPGAENGLKKWGTFAGFMTRAYGAAGLGFPPNSEGKRIGGGKRFFYAGPYDSALGTCGSAARVIRLRGIGRAIDTGHVRVRLRGYAGTNASPGITAHSDLYFRDADNHQVAVNGISRSVAGTNEAYRLLRGKRALPKKTRILRVHMWADGDAPETSGDCQAFWDRISVVIERI